MIELNLNKIYKNFGAREASERIQLRTENRRKSGLNRTKW